MDSILELLINQLGHKNISQISNMLGTDEKSTSSALTTVLPSLVMALARNSSNPEGAQSLSNAISKDHDGSILDDLPGFLSQAEEGPGAGILKHVLGDRTNNVESGLSKATGMDVNSIGKLMKMVAPLVLGALGKIQKEKNLAAQGISGLLNNERQRLEEKSPQPMSLFSQLLDSNHDGDITDDVLRMGAGLLGKLFRKE